MRMFSDLQAAVQYIDREIKRLDQLREALRRSFQECGEFFPRRDVCEDIPITSRNDKGRTATAVRRRSS
jgi:hypothetical protein